MQDMVTSKVVGNDILVFITKDNLDEFFVGLKDSPDANAIQIVKTLIRLGMFETRLFPSFAYFIL